MLIYAARVCGLFWWECERRRVPGAFLPRTSLRRGLVLASFPSLLQSKLRLRSQPPHHYTLIKTTEMDSAIGGGVLEYLVRRTDDQGDRRAPLTRSFSGDRVFRKASQLDSTS